MTGADGKNTRAIHDMLVSAQGCRTGRFMGRINGSECATMEILARARNILYILGIKLTGGSSDTDMRYVTGLKAVVRKKLRRHVGRPVSHFHGNRAQKEG